MSNIVSANSVITECFVCHSSLNEGEVIVVKERGIQTLIKSSAERRLRANERLLKTLSQVPVHLSCQKNYNKPQLITAFINRSQNETLPLRSTSAQFDFKSHCVLCAEEITDAFIEGEKKKPVSRRNLVHKIEQDSVKDSFSKAAEKRGDEWGKEIIERITDQDLPAKDARYHIFCQRKLYKPPNTGIKRGYRPANDVDEAMECIYTYLEENAEECQFSLEELLDQIEGDFRPNYRTVKNRLLNKYGEDIVITETANKKRTVCFRNLGYKILSKSWYDKQHTDPYQEKLRVVKAAADIIIGDIRSKVYTTSEYTPPDNFFTDVESVVPESLLLFLQTVVLKNKRSSIDKWKKKCIALAHVLISAARPRSFVSSLLNAVGVYVYQKFGSKQLIELLSALGFSSTYSETSILEISTIVRPEQIAMNEGAFLQFVFDNADFNVNTIDGLNTFHAMGGIMTVTPYDFIEPDKSVARVTNCTSKELVKTVGRIELAVFKKRKNTGLETVTVADLQRINPIEDEMLPDPVHSLWLFGKSLKTVTLPGWNGFMEGATQNQPFKRSKVLCLPFINSPPSQYDTILTAIQTAQLKCETFNMKTCFVTFDQPLYVKGKEIVSNNPEFRNVVVRLGGFHMLMSYMGAIGTIMDGSGLKELFNSIYALNSVEKLMSGHAYSRAVRAHCLAHRVLAQLILETVTYSDEEKDAIEGILTGNDTLLLKAFENEIVETLTVKFKEALQKLEQRGPTAKLWVQYFQMTTLIKQFIEAERSGKWDLHITTIQQMLPFFHAAGHFFYAKCGHLYVQDMLNLKDRIDPTDYEKFTNDGYFTIRRKDKFWSGIWTDQTIEQTLMKTMKSSGGLTRGRGITESVLTRWTLGMIHFHNICEEVEEYCNITSVTSEQHVDTRPTRITRDNEDVDKLMRWFSNREPFPEIEVLMSINSGFVGSEAVNCHMSQEIGYKGMSRIIGNNFRDVKFKRKDKVVTLASVNNSAKIGKEKITMNPLTLFHRICIAKQSEEDLKFFFEFELSPFPLSLFNVDGMRKGTKSSLFSAFHQIQRDSTKGENNFTVVDGGHLLHKVVWQRNVTFKDIAHSYVKYLQTHYGSNVAVVFDGYPDLSEMSTKNAERKRRGNLHKTREIIFTYSTYPEISQEPFLANENNKVRFIDLLKIVLQEANIIVKQAEEDADVLIVETAISKNNSKEYDNIFVVGEDIDLLVILTALAPTRDNIFFQKCGKGKKPDVLYSTTSFKEQHIGMILFIHAFSGCDTTSALFGQGKVKFSTIFRKFQHLEEKMRIFLDPNATTNEVAEAGEIFLIHLYGGDPTTCTLNELRYKLFAKSALGLSTSTLPRLPPTTDAASLHAFRSYLQIQNWLGNKKNPAEWGWIKTRYGLSPHKMVKDAAPESLLNLISCSCKKGCKNACGCRKIGLLCSTLCGCSIGEGCGNMPDILPLEDDIAGATVFEEMEDNEEEEEEKDYTETQHTELDDQPGPSKKPRNNSY